jgi:hypothetical protein
VVERSERHASVAKPEEPQDFNDERGPCLLAAGFPLPFTNYRLSQGWRRRFHNISSL